MPDITIKHKMQSDVKYPEPSPLNTFSATALSSSSIQLGWVDPNLATLTYEIQYDFTGLFPSPTTITVAATPDSGGTNTITGLQNNTTYHFRIRAKNPGNTYSDWVTTVESTPM